jgi:hypothetical protein
MRASAYRDRFVLEATRESLGDGILVGLLNDARRRREDAVGRFALPRIGSHAHLEEDLQELRPWLVYLDG